jgi:hypothetical protein
MCSKAARAIAAHSATIALGCCSDVVPVSTDCPTACFTNADMVRHIVGDRRVSRDGLGAREYGTPIREAMIHLVTALEFGSDLRQFVAYDARLLAAARDAGLPTLTPR